MSERFVFQHNPTLGQIEQAGETRQGQQALAQIKAEFSSVADVLHHLQGFGGDSSVLHLPEGGGITLIHLSKPEIVHLLAPNAAAIDQAFF